MKIKLTPEFLKQTLSGSVRIGELERENVRLQKIIDSNQGLQAAARLERYETLIGMLSKYTAVQVRERAIICTYGDGQIRSLIVGTEADTRAFAAMLNERQKLP